MSELLLAVDGGGSKTRALLTDSHGNLLGTGSGASSNAHHAGWEAATASMEAAIAGALSSAGVAAGRSITAAAFGIAGIDRPADRAPWERWLAEGHTALPGRPERVVIERWTIVNDVELLLAAGTPDGWGCALICGTGSICWGRAPDGRMARAGGWGAILGDEGSGYDVAVRALRLATQTADGRAEAHGLLAGVLRAWQLGAPEELIGRVYDAQSARPMIAGLARHITSLAEGGDADAVALLEDAGRELAKQVLAVARRLDLQRTSLALGGGFLGGASLLQQAMLRELGALITSQQFVSDPAVGAVVIAQRLLE